MPVFSPVSMHKNIFVISEFSEQSGDFAHLIDG